MRKISRFFLCFYEIFRLTQLGLEIGIYTNHLVTGIGSFNKLLDVSCVCYGLLGFLGMSVLGIYLYKNSDKVKEREEDKYERRYIAEHIKLQLLDKFHEIYFTEKEKEKIKQVNQEFLKNFSENKHDIVLASKYERIISEITWKNLSNTQKQQLENFIEKLKLDNGEYEKHLENFLQKARDFTTGKTIKKHIEDLENSIKMGIFKVAKQTKKEKSCSAEQALMQSLSKSLKEQSDLIQEESSILKKLENITKRIKKKKLSIKLIIFNIGTGINESKKLVDDIEKVSKEEFVNKCNAFKDEPKVALFLKAIQLEELYDALIRCNNNCLLVEGSSANGEYNLQRLQQLLKEIDKLEREIQEDIKTLQLNTQESIDTLKPNTQKTIGQIVEEEGIWLETQY